MYSSYVSGSDLGAFSICPYRELVRYYLLIPLQVSPSLTLVSNVFPQQIHLRSNFCFLALLVPFSASIVCIRDLKLLYHIHHTFFQTCEQSSNCCSSAILYK